jgi:membrane-bound lytic murein transglycosylase B
MRHAVLCALASGGLTIAGLGGPLAGGALATNTPASTTGSSTTPTTTSTSAAPSPEASSSDSSSTSSTSTTTTTPTETSTTPQDSAPSSPVAAEAPKVVLQRKQKATAGTQASSSVTPAKVSKQTAQPATKEKETAAAKKQASAANNVAPSPESVAEEGALAAALDSSAASAQALDFYRIPLFLLPVYKAAAVQYGVPWQVLAAINEVETDYGNDLSVSTAGAVGWMQFMPSTWLQYGVDALDAGYADPYNPVDAIFAAARYLRAAGAQTDLRAAILAYNHSEAYASSVLLRAKLISAYPKAVVSTLTGLIDGRPPVTGKQLVWSTPVGESSSTSSASVIPSKAVNTSTPGSTLAPSPTAAATARTSATAAPSPKSLDFDDLTSAPNASVVAVEDGRVEKIGDSRRLGKYVVLRDVYGDVFTYAGLGSIASTYSLAKSASEPTKSPVVEAASSRAPTPTQPASAGTQSPATQHAETSLQSGLLSSDLGQLSLSLLPKEQTLAGTRNPAAVAHTARKTQQSTTPQKVPLRRGSVVASGTVLGHVGVPSGDRDGHLRFAIRPAGDTSTIDPGPVLANWKQLQTALHPRGAKASNALLGATTSDLFLMSKDQLESTVLADPDITMTACERREVAAGRVDKRVLAVLAFLSRSGLAPTVSALRCGQDQHTASGALSAQYNGDAVDIAAINGIPIVHHQGAGTITDLTIRALLTLPSGFVPHEIVSLTRYPGASNTRAEASSAKEIRLQFSPTTASAAHLARAGRNAPAPLETATSALSAAQWNQLMTRVAALPAPTVATKPSSAAVTDPKRG